MQMARRGGTVVIGGLKDRKPVDGFISDWIPMRQLHLHAGFPGDHVKTSVKLIRQGRVPTAALLGEAVTVDGLGDALSLLARTLPGRDAIRLALRMAD
jgi:threonine dehydrogenase-like Zn-dependent dehydrogenase